MLYRTKNGDVLDAICNEYYGQANGTIEVVLEANPGLAESGPVYRSGKIIELPDIVLPIKEANSIRLWD